MPNSRPIRPSCWMGIIEWLFPTHWTVAKQGTMNCAAIQSCLSVPQSAIGQMVCPSYIDSPGKVERHAFYERTRLFCLGGWDCELFLQRSIGSMIVVSASRMVLLHWVLIFLVDAPSSIILYAHSVGGVKFTSAQTLLSQLGTVQTNTSLQGDLVNPHMRQIRVIGYHPAACGLWAFLSTT